MQSSERKAPGAILPTVQILRGVAALMVAYLHLYAVSGYEAELWPSFWPADVEVLARGVDIFFVISGFIMLVTSRSMAPGDFILRRLVRIAPLYWFFTLLIVVAATTKPDLFRTTVVTLGGAIKSLAFIPYVNEGRPDEISPLLPPGWTLNYEMMFYAVFTGALFAPLRYRVALCAGIFSILVASRITAADEQSAVVRFYSDPILFEFVGGMIVGHLYLSSLKLSKATCWSMIAIGFGLILTAVLDVHPGDVTWRPIAYGLPSCLIVLGGVCLDKGGTGQGTWRVPALLGDASYSIYLSHMFVLGAERSAWKVLGLAQQTAWHAAGFALVGMAGVCVGGVLCYWYIEKPLLHSCQGLLRRVQLRRPAANR